MRKFATSVILVLALLLVAGGIGAAVIWQRIHDPYKGFTEAEQFIDVTPGTGTSAIGRTLVDAGLIRDEERRSLAGVAGLSDLPLVGRLFAHNQKETKETDIILTLTPRIVRVLDLTPTDLAAFRVGRDGGAGGVDLPPLPVPVPQPATPPRPPGGTVQPPPPGDAAPGAPVLAPTVPTPGTATPIKPPPRPGGN